jgi:hypothetical protein
MSFETPTKGALVGDVGDAFRVTPDVDSAELQAGNTADPPASLSNAHVAYSPPASTKRFTKAEPDVDNINKRRKTYFIGDEEDSMQRNTILPLVRLQSFFARIFVAKNVAPCSSLAC